MWRRNLRVNQKILNASMFVDILKTFLDDELKKKLITKIIKN